MGHLNPTSAAGIEFSVAQPYESRRVRVQSDTVTSAQAAYRVASLAALAQQNPDGVIGASLAS
jgi:hypothetical protein